MWQWQATWCRRSPRRALALSSPPRLGLPSLAAVVLLLCALATVTPLPSLLLQRSSASRFWQSATPQPGRTAERGRRLFQTASESDFDLKYSDSSGAESKYDSEAGGPARFQAGAALAHNLAGSVSQEQLASFYQQKLQLLLDNTMLLQWVQPHARHRFCFPCVKGPSPQVALVGNGPLSAEQRANIAKSNCVVRFNRMNNRVWEGDERADIWIIRGTTGNKFHVPLWAAKEVGNVQGIVLAHDFLRAYKIAQWAGVQGSIKPSYPWTGSIEGLAGALGLNQSQGAAKLLPLELGPLVAFWNSVTMQLGYTHRPSLPSTGFVGILALLECFPLDGTLNLYGFNWSTDAYEAHFMAVEASFIRLIQQRRPGRLVGHPTPCGSYTKCDSSKAR